MKFHIVAVLIGIAVAKKQSSVAETKTLDDQFMEWAQSCFRNRDCLKCASFFNGSDKNSRSSAELTGAALQVYDWCADLHYDGSSTSSTSSKETNDRDVDEKFERKKSRSQNEASARMVYVPSYKAAIDDNINQNVTNEQTQGVFFGSVWSVPAGCDDGTFENNKNQNRQLYEVEPSGSPFESAVVDLVDGRDLKNGHLKNKDKTDKTVSKTGDNDNLKSVRETTGGDAMAVDDEHSAPLMEMKEDKKEKKEKKEEKEEKKAEKKKSDDKTTDDKTTDDKKTDSQDESTSIGEKSKSENQEKSSSEEKKKSREANKKEKKEEKELKKQNENSEDKKKEHPKSSVQDKQPVSELVAADFGSEMSHYIHEAAEELGLVKKKTEEQNSTNMTNSENEKNRMKMMLVSPTETETDDNNKDISEKNLIISEPSSVESKQQISSSNETDSSSADDDNEIPAAPKRVPQTVESLNQKYVDEEDENEEIVASAIADLWTNKVAAMRQNEKKEEKDQKKMKNKKCELKRQRIAVVVKRDNESGSDKFIELRLFSRLKTADNATATANPINETELSNKKMDSASAIENVWKTISVGDCDKVSNLVDERPIEEHEKEYLKIAAPFLKTNKNNKNKNNEKEDETKTESLRHFSQLVKQHFPKFDGPSMPLSEIVEYACLIANATARDRSVVLRHMVNDKNGREAMAIVKVEEDLENKNKNEKNKNEKNNSERKFISFMKMNPETKKISEWNNYRAESVPVNVESVVADLYGESSPVAQMVPSAVRSGFSLSQISIPILLLTSVTLLWHYSSSSKKQHSGYGAVQSAPGYEELLP